MNILKFVKPGKIMVIEIEYAEYLFEDEGIQMFKDDEPLVLVRILFGGQQYLMPKDVVERAIRKKGIIDYLDIKNPS
ncbi:MAG TPA: hypothetical protein VGE63_02275 [Candidatus Paceibacterota bacterium]